MPSRGLHLGFGVWLQSLRSVLKWKEDNPRLLLTVENSNAQDDKVRLVDMVVTVVVPPHRNTAKHDVAKSVD